MTRKENVFYRIANDFALKKGYNIDELKFFSYHCCPDQYVGKIEEIQKYKRFSRENVKKIAISGNKYMILILESPHQDEFQYADDDSLRLPIGPANGVTGVYIWKYIAEIFGNKYKDYGLILMNAIPFQCSLGVDTEEFRDEVFSKTWDDNDQDKKIGESFFEERLGSLLKKLAGKSVVIVNACTSGGGRKQAVQEVIDEIAPDIKRLKTPHPSSWYNPENRRYTQVKYT